MMLAARLSPARRSAPSLRIIRHLSSSTPRSRQKLVILGSGWGGYEILRKVERKKWDVTMVSPTTHFNFTPLLAGCAVGTLEFRCAIEPVRRYTPAVTAYQAWCDKIDFQRKVLECTPATALPTGYSEESSSTNGKFKIEYDKLVIAVGAYSQTFNVPGVKENACFLKDIKDARAIRSRIIECLEEASQPIVSDIDRRNLMHFCIVGGGPTGVEFAAELHDLLHEEVRKHYPALARLARISLFDVAPNILGSFDKSLIQYAEKTFAREGIQVLTSHNVDKVEKGKMFVRETGEVPFGLLVWSTGLAPNPLVQSITEVKKDQTTGRSLQVNKHLNVVNEDGSINEDVFALGDAAMDPDAKLPATAQVANQQAKYLAKKFNRIVREKPSPDEFKFQSKGSLAYIGNWKAIYDKSESKDLMNQETGRAAFLIWRSAYMTLTLSVRNKILVPIYWFMNWLFGRDLTRF